MNIEPYGRFLPDYAAVLFRMALTGFLGLQVTEQAPDRKHAKAFAEYEERWFNYTKYQRDIEAAIATVHVSAKKKREQKGLMR